MLRSGTKNVVSESKPLADEVGGLFEFGAIYALVDSMMSMLNSMMKSLGCMFGGCKE